jgi:hypothetical protein
MSIFNSYNHFGISHWYLNWMVMSAKKIWLCNIAKISATQAGPNFIGNDIIPIRLAGRAGTLL